jgi:DNA-binding HxlR family transcriptional regulator
VVVNEIPPRVEYTLTEKGRTLEPVIGALAAWGHSASTGSGPA